MQVCLCAKALLYVQQTLQHLSHQVLLPCVRTRVVLRPGDVLDKRKESGLRRETEGTGTAAPVILGSALVRAGPQLRWAVGLRYLRRPQELSQ